MENGPSEAAQWYDLAVFVLNVKAVFQDLKIGV